MTGESNGMILRVLGCFGRLTAVERSTGFLVDSELLLDGGTIVSALDDAAVDNVRWLCLSHAHLDHIKEIPFFVQARMGRGAPPVVLAGVPEVLSAVRAHLFNGVVWPDFSRIGNPPPLVYREIKPQTWEDFGAYRVMAVPVNHGVPCTGFLVTRGELGLAYSADTVTTDAVWREIARAPEITAVCIETSFPDRMEEFARITHHFTPALAAADIRKIGRPVRVLVTHTRLADIDEIRRDYDKTALRVEYLEQDSVYRI